MAPRRRILNAILATTSLSVAFGLAETAVRVFAHSGSAVGKLVRDWDPRAVLVEPHGDLGYRQRPGAAFHYKNGTVAHTNSAGYRGPRVQEPKPPSTFRVVLLGGSTSYGWGVDDDDTIDAELRRILGARTALSRVEVVNLALDGYDSYQDLERMRSDGVRLQPDLVIVNSGINDVRNARFANLSYRDPRTLLYENVLARLREEQRRGHSSLRTQIKHYSYLARLPGVLRQLREQSAMAQAGSRSAVDTAARRESRERALDQFEANVIAIAALADSAGAAVLLSSPPSSLRVNYAPTATSGISYWIDNAETTQSYRDAFDERLQLLARRLAARGKRVRYVAHEVDRTMFLDDCHLTVAGNAQVAHEFADASLGYMASSTVLASLSGRAPRHRHVAMR